MGMCTRSKRKTTALPIVQWACAAAKLTFLYGSLSLAEMAAADAKQNSITDGKARDNPPLRFCYVDPVT